MKEAPAVSVIIPSYNEATYIGRLLEALSRQNFESFEVIVSDAESKDGIKKVIKSFSGKLDIKLVQTPPRGPAAGRNEGAKAARGEWLLFLDADDDIDDPNFIKTLLEEAQRNSWKTASAAMKTKKRESFLNRLGIALFYRYQKLLAHTKHPVAQGYCIFTQAKVFKNSHGFNEKIHYGEDNDYVSRVGKHGFGFVDTTYYYVDLRRFRQEGFLFPVKNTLHELYRLTHLSSLERQPFKYEFGKHKKRDQN